MSCFGFVIASVWIPFVFYEPEQQMNRNEIIYGQIGRNDEDITLRGSRV